MKKAIALLLSVVTLGMCAVEPACAEDRDTARNLVNKGNYLMAANRFAEALKTYEQALTHDPGNAIIKDNIAILHNNWGRWYTSQRKYLEAREQFEKSLQLQPNYGPAKANLVLLSRYASEAGVDLDAPLAEPAANVPIPPSCVNAPRPGEPQAPKVAPTAPSAGAVLFIGGVQQETQPSAPVDVPVVNAYPVSSISAPPEPAVSGAAIIVQPSVPAAPVRSTVNNAAPTASASRAEFTMKPQNPLFPMTPNQFVQQQGAPLSGAVIQHQQPVAPVNTPAAVVTPRALTSAVSANLSIDDQLALVEMKVYGARQGDLTVLQRLEKMERECAGQTRAGTIIDRINYLRSTFGM